MLNCKQVSRLVSQAMDAKLPWHQGLAIRFHLLYCSWCRRYASQLQFLRRASKGLSEEPIKAAAPTLSDGAKERMRKQLRETLTNPSDSSQ
jgi:hypothetical protein